MLANSDGYGHGVWGRQVPGGGGMYYFDGSKNDTDRGQHIKRRRVNLDPAQERQVSRLK